jgi:hypothetical protein
MQNRFGRHTSFREIILLSGVFCRETASVFYPWSNVVSPRKRVAEGLCSWRHGLTQSAQSHRQMRSIPRCFKAVFYVFVFGPIHDSETMRNLSPGLFPLSRKNQRKCYSIFVVVMDYFFVVGVGFGHEAVERGMV